MNFFSNKELSCKCCGVNKFNSGTLKKLNNLRQSLGFPLRLSSAYRCKEYNIKIGATQTHATGQAIDILCSHKQAELVNKNYNIFGFTGIGIKQKGKSRFIHLDDLDEDLDENRPRPHIWSY